MRPRFPCRTGCRLHRASQRRDGVGRALCHEPVDAVARQGKNGAGGVVRARKGSFNLGGDSAKTAWDTGCILSISTDTVNKHMASAMRKLKAYTKTQAVAESLGATRRNPAFSKLMSMANPMPTPRPA